VAPLVGFDLERYFKNDVLTLLRKENAISQEASATALITPNRAKVGLISACLDAFFSIPWRSMALCGEK
jgi:hypothetical protein